MSDRLAEIEARWAAADPTATWEVGGPSDTDHPGVQILTSVDGVNGAEIVADVWADAGQPDEAALPIAEALAYAPEDIEWLLGEVRRQREALAFYADESNWQARVLRTVPGGEPNAGAQECESGPALDAGARARAALREPVS